ncbi:MAG: indolepyruvate oxidoreductase subunit beta [Chloroflexota bacterium]
MTDFVLVGVGGQGIILASDVLAEVGSALGYDVKKADVHGMSQRGGSVTSHVRWGPKVYSPVLPRGGAGYMLAFEIMEGARHLEYLARDGVAIVNNQRIAPLPVASGLVKSPATEDLMGLIRGHARQVVEIDALGIARELGQPAVVSTVLLGAVASLLGADRDVWLGVIRRRVPAKWLAANEAAFQKGWDAVSTLS